MHPLLEKLGRQGPVVTDGAWGTQLQARGLEVGTSPEVWNLQHPEQVEQVARGYVEAGSQLILTNTFGGSRLALQRHGLAAHTAQVNQRGVELSRRAAGTRAHVFASMGPSGKLLMAGEVTPDELLDAFAEQAEALAEGGAEAIVVETMTDAEEARIAVAAARQTCLPVICSMVFDSGPDRDRTLMGLTVEAAVAAMVEAGADVVGANCGQGIAAFIPVCRRLRAATDRPVWIKPNAGLPEMAEGRVVYRTSAAQFAAHVPALVAAGASFVGGCCGTAPAFIRAVAEKLAARR
ncbi:MAG: homocysteine S-methyltransferase family protein [Candidatus Latescibacterota bacterium]